MSSCKWENYFFSLAKETSFLSKDPSMKVGSVIVNTDSKLPISTGYNGFPRGICDDKKNYLDKNKKYSMIVHSEANSLYNACRVGVNVFGCSIFIYGLPPCSECTKALIQCGIKEINYCIKNNNSMSEKWKESFDISLGMLEQTDIKIIKFIEDEMGILWKEN